MNNKQVQIENLVLPWVFDAEYSQIVDAEDLVVCNDEYCEPNYMPAIVQAINNHGALVKSLHELLANVGGIEALGEWEATNINRGMCKKLQIQVDDVISRAHTVLAAERKTT